MMRRTMVLLFVAVMFPLLLGATTFQTAQLEREVGIVAEQLVYNGCLPDYWQEIFVINADGTNRV